MKTQIKGIGIGVFAVIGLTVLLMGFTSHENIKNSNEVYEFEIVSVVESLIPGGSGRSRMISKTQNVDYLQSTTVRLNNGKKLKKDKSRSEIRTKTFEETKILNFYNIGGIRFENIATNDGIVKSKLNEMSEQGWELINIAAGVESADEVSTAIFITRYYFKRIKP